MNKKTILTFLVLFVSGVLAFFFGISLIPPVHTP